MLPAILGAVGALGGGGGGGLPGFSDSASSGVSNSGNNAVITHGRNGSSLPMFPFGSASSDDSELNMPLIVGAVCAVILVIAAIGSARHG